MHCVVGSGPSGIACAQALLQKGLAVRMLDAGLTLEPERARAVEQLAASAPADWDPKLVSLLKENSAPTAKGLPQKLVYGSDFPYRESELNAPGSFDGVGLRPSLAQGGFSNVWGAALMPYIDADLVDWPFKTAELAEHYSAVLKFVGMAAREDELAAIFPLHTTEPGGLELSRQARALLQRMDRNKTALHQGGIHHGAARVAIKTQRSPEQPGCVYCGMCMYGCPYGYIYNSASTLAEMRQNERFIYQPDTIVTSFAETADGVTIHAQDRLTGKPLQIETERLYLAAGVLPTTKLILESRGCYDQPVWIKDSQYLLLPLLLFQNVPGVRQEPLHALSQLFLEIMDPKISPFSVHLQLYSYSGVIADAVRESLRRFGLNFDFLARQLEQRLMVIQGFLHSNHSAKIAAVLKRTGNGRSRLELKAELNPETKKIIRKITAKLMRHTWNLGALPLLPMLQIPEPGRSFHSGGTFPMRAQPGPLESDTLGRPCGWKRVHAVDSTVLPSVPASTITLSVMANAHRIGCKSAEIS